MTACLALVFSLMAPGAGHALTGNWGQALLLGGIFALGKNALLPLALRLLNVRSLRHTLQAFYVCNWVYIGLILYACASAFWGGLQASNLYFLRAVFFVISVRLVQKNTKSKIIFTALCGREGIYELEQQLRPSPTVKNKK